MGTVQISEVEVSAEDDIGTIRIAGVGAEVDAPTASGVVRIARVAVETDTASTGTIRLARVTVETGEIPEQLPAWFWTSGTRTWRARKAYSGLTGSWT